MGMISMILIFCHTAQATTWKSLAKALCGNKKMSDEQDMDDNPDGSPDGKRRCTTKCCLLTSAATLLAANAITGIANKGPARGIPEPEMKCDAMCQNNQSKATLSMPPTAAIPKPDRAIKKVYNEKYFNEFPATKKKYNEKYFNEFTEAVEDMNTCAKYGCDKPHEAIKRAVEVCSTPGKGHPLSHTRYCGLHWALGDDVKAVKPKSAPFHCPQRAQNVTAKLDQCETHGYAGAHWHTAIEHVKAHQDCGPDLPLDDPLYD